jgi:hypothetical protein
MSNRSTRDVPGRRYVAGLAVLFAVIWLLLAIRPRHPADWALENALVVLAVLECQPGTASSLEIQVDWLLRRGVHAPHVAKISRLERCQPWHMDHLLRAWVQASYLHSHGANNHASNRRTPMKRDGPHGLWIRAKPQARGRQVGAAA